MTDTSAHLRGGTFSSISWAIYGVLSNPLVYFSSSLKGQRMIRPLGSLVKPALFAILAILAAAQSATAAKPPSSSPPPFRYRVVYLGVLPGDSLSYGIAVNSFGEVVGRSHNATTGSRAFLYTPGVGLLDLNTVIDPALNLRLEDATAINDAGQIGGYGHAGVPGSGFGYRLTPPTAPATDWIFERTAPGYGGAVGLNQDGDVLAPSDLGFCIWPAGGNPILLGNVGRLVRGLSDRDVAGVVQFAVASGQAGVSGKRVLYQIGTDPSTITYQAIGSIGANWSDPFAIGGSGHIVGEGLVAVKRTTQVDHAFVQTGGASTIQDIGTLGGEDSWASAVNRFGDIIGMAETAQNTGLGDQYDSRFIRTGGATPKMYDLEKMIDGPLPNEFANMSQISDSRIICGPNYGGAGIQAWVLIPYTP